MLSSKAWSGVNNLLDDYIKLRQNDCVVIAYAPDSKECAAWIAAALDERVVRREFVWMKPLKDPTFGNRIRKSLLSLLPSEGRIIVLTLERDTMSHSFEILNSVQGLEAENCVLVRMISVCPDLFSTALLAKSSELSAKNTSILERLMKAQFIRVTTKSGTDLKVGLNSNIYRWISNRGYAPPGMFMILPAGEVATYPDSIEGVLVADFAFNVNIITDIDARLRNCPVTISIEQGEVTSFSCQDSSVERLISGCFQFPNGKRVGEIGFGTNSYVSNGTSLNSHINERRPGVHLGFGDHNQHKLVDYKSRIHLDLIAKGGTIWIDEEPYPLNLDALKPSSHPHPDFTIHQDAFEFNPMGKGQHCCGIMSMNTVESIYSAT